ncbi:CGNR zinc finger domain-containing protein [Sphingobium sp. AS12]|uniref:CGNR zinc finger domain-containing protein n=1 Tax=Sphingobium sp. AS12 TaxID=2849495 RepID=UPI001C314B3B|nr:CGNR zinc finger domain-containing protein [Sphingobium sp. AS12]MBV2149846.1 CGNR zinc finger domain-containing protein [Sphingobium sp. AS12]
MLPVKGTASHEETRDGFRFRGGHAALDLTATLTGRLKEAQRDLFAGPEDVVRWLWAAGFECVQNVPDDHLLDSARLLREAIYILTMGRIMGQVPPARERTVLNDIARLPAAAPEFDSDGSARLCGDAGALLAFIAREAVLLLGGEMADRVRQCEGEGCAIVFLDTSRSGDRRWCSMAACGNRHKVAAFRQRKRKP